MDDIHAKYMKRCYELAISAGKKGHDMNTGENSTGMLKTPDGQIFFCMKKSLTP